LQSTLNDKNQRSSVPILTNTLTHSWQVEECAGHLRSPKGASQGISNGRCPVAVKNTEGADVRRNPLGDDGHAVVVRLVVVDGNAP
jgi:hypothetical protein